MSTDERIEVKTADFSIGKAPQILETRGIGSCVAVCLYEKNKKIGALMHIMLPKSNEDQLNPLRFADTAFALVFKEFEKLAVSKKNLDAKIVGGASMFQITEESIGNIGTRNIKSVESILQNEGISLHSKDTGGTVGRSLEFFLDTGIVEVHTVM